LAESASSGCLPARGYLPLKKFVLFFRQISVPERLNPIYSQVRQRPFSQKRAQEPITEQPEQNQKIA
jgi:hypothetical protein